MSALEYIVPGAAELIQESIFVPMGAESPSFLAAPLGSLSRTDSPQTLHELAPAIFLTTPRRPPQSPNQYPCTASVHREREYSRANIGDTRPDRTTKIILKAYLGERTRSPNASRVVHWLGLSRN